VFLELVHLEQAALALLATGEPAVADREQPRAEALPPEERRNSRGNPKLAEFSPCAFT
jgi:hypothetical protein